MKELGEDKFSVFIPFEIEKAGDGQDRYSNMRIKGIASSPHHGSDSDGETLDPAGMDLTALLKQGNINFHHLWTKDPMAIIGEPTKAEITKDNELYIEGRLYPSSQKARDVYDLGEILEKDSETRRLGFSIEGTALTRDPKNKKKILKSRLTAVAITPSPKCKGTRMDIMKGELTESSYELIKAEGIEGDYLVDIVDETGVRHTVDKNFVIKAWTSDDLEKAMQAGSVTGRDTTNQVLGQESLKVESVDGKKKKKKKNFSKGEMYNTIFSIFKISDTSLIKNVYSLIEDIQKGITPNMENGITQEAIDKAKDLLKKGGGQGPFGDDVKAGAAGISAEERSTLKIDTNVQAGKDVEAKKLSRESWDKVKFELENVKMVVKQYQDALSNIDIIFNSGDMGTPDGDALDKPADDSMGTIDNLGKPNEQSQLKLDTSVTTASKVAKAESEELVKAQVDELTKGLTEKISQLSVSLSTKEIENTELKKSFDTLNEKVDQFLKSSPGPKSKITSTPIERFDPIKEGERTLSLKNNKKQIVDALVKAAGDDFNENNIFAQAASAVEIAGALGSTPKEANLVATELRKKSGIVITG